MEPSLSNNPSEDTSRSGFTSPETPLSPVSDDHSPVSSDEGFGGIADAVLVEPTSDDAQPNSTGNPSSEDESGSISIEDAPELGEPSSTIFPDAEPIASTPVTPARRPVVPADAPIESATEISDAAAPSGDMFIGPSPEPPVSRAADPITGMSFDELVQQILRSLNPAPSRSSQQASSRQASNATASIADEVKAPARAPASTAASATAETTEQADEICRGLSKLDELTFRLHDGFELRSGHDEQSTARMLTNYGNDSDDRTFVRVTDRRNPFAKSGTAYFEGEVQFGEVFTARADIEGAEAFRSKVYLHYFDEENHNILRSVQYSASCDAPVRVNDELGGATVIAFR